MSEFSRLTIYCTTFPSKKNSKTAFFSKHTKKMMVLSSNEYQSWEKSAIIQIKAWQQDQKINKSAQFPIKSCAVSLIFYFPTKHRRDLSNASEGVFDSLVKCGVIADDNWQVMNPVTLRGRLSTNKPRVEIYLSDPKTDEYSR